MKNKKSNRTRYGTFGFINDGLDDNSFVDDEGDRWFTDEYGDKGEEWTTCGTTCLMDLDGQFKLGHLLLI